MLSTVPSPGISLTWMVMRWTSQGRSKLSSGKRVQFFSSLQILANLCQIPKHSMYEMKLKPIMSALNLLKMCLGGCVINFGVFSLFHDDSLERAMEIGVQLLLSLSDSELHITVFTDNRSLDVGWSNSRNCEDLTSAKPGGTNALAEKLSRINTANNSSNSNNNNNSLYLLNLNVDNNSNNSNINNNSNVMKPNDNSNNELLMSHLILGKGGASNHAVWSSRATLASTNLLNLLVMNNATTTTTVPGNLESLEMQSGVTLLRRILILLLSSVMQEDCRCQWSMSRPLLPLILLNQQVCVFVRVCFFIIEFFPFISLLFGYIIHRST
ncbi:unnamed protein product [Trichobilharzia regenti]|nr:unnamed protein product [Trichobilharzia regenti]